MPMDIRLGLNFTSITDDILTLFGNGGGSMKTQILSSDYYHS
jgi:hypothetical protein